MGTGNIQLEGNPAITYMSRVGGGGSNTPRHASFQGNQEKLWPFEPLA